MTDRIGAIGSQDDMFSKMKKLLKNPIEKNNAGSKGAFVAFNDETLSKTGAVPGYADVSIHTQSTYS